MTERRRSPNYPAVSFPVALDMAWAIYDKAQRHKTDKESLAQILGYSGLNGKSLRLLGTLNAHGLLAGNRNEMGITEEGEAALIDPRESESRHEARIECAYKPAIYREIMDKFEWEPPASDEIVRSLVLKKGFSQKATDELIRNFRDTLNFIIEDDLNLPRGQSEGPKVSAQAVSAGSAGSSFMPQPAATASDNTGRELFRYDFEPSGHLRLVVSGKVDTEEALDVLEDLIEMKRREVKRKAKARAGQKDEGNGEPETGD